VVQLVDRARIGGAPPGHIHREHPEVGGKRGQIPLEIAPTGRTNPRAVEHDHGMAGTGFVVMEIPI
jgi:hypothetical protein